jgi:hypothetical protein
MAARCDIIHYVKNYIKPIMQALTVKIKDYNMRLITTKCLNTAVTFMVLFFGQDGGLEQTEYCDVDVVQRRHRASNSNAGPVDRNPTLVKALARDVLEPTDVRCVYYVMLTNGTFVKPDGSGTASFPGHVMVWEKVPVAGQLPKYYIYQSYINEYEYKGSPSFSQQKHHISHVTMNYYMETLQRYLTKPQAWDHNMRGLWATLTGVDTEDLLEGVPNDCFYLCWRKRLNGECLRNLQVFVKEVIGELPRSGVSMDQIYGDPSLYMPRSRPLTNRQMADAFIELDQELTSQLGNVSSPVRIGGTGRRRRSVRSKQQ